MDTWLVLFFFYANCFWVDEQVPVEDFVQQVFPHGVPGDVAKSYTSMDSAKLVAMLQQASTIEYHSNIVETLGFIGDSSATSAVINYIEQASGHISNEAFGVKSNAFLSLGYMVNKGGNSVALTYLVGSMEMEVWWQRNLKWRVAYLPDPVARNSQLVRQAAVGLTLSAHPKAALALKKQLPA